MDRNGNRRGAAAAVEGDGDSDGELPPQSATERLMGLRDQIRGLRQTQTEQRSSGGEGEGEQQQHRPPLTANKSSEATFRTVGTRDTWASGEKWDQQAPSSTDGGGATSSGDIMRSMGTLRTARGVNAYPRDGEGGAAAMERRGADGGETSVYSVDLNDIAAEAADDYEHGYENEHSVVHEIPLVDPNDTSVSSLQDSHYASPRQPLPPTGGMVDALSSRLAERALQKMAGDALRESGVVDFGTSGTGGLDPPATQSDYGGDSSEYGGDSSVDRMMALVGTDGGGGNRATARGKRSSMASSGADSFASARSREEEEDDDNNRDSYRSYLLDADTDESGHYDTSETEESRMHHDRHRQYTRPTNFREFTAPVRFDDDSSADASTFGEGPPSHRREQSSRTMGSTLESVSEPPLEEEEGDTSPSEGSLHRAVTQQTGTIDRMEETQQQQQQPRPPRPPSLSAYSGSGSGSGSASDSRERTTRSQPTPPATNTAPPAAIVKPYAFASPDPYSSSSGPSIGTSAPAPASRRRPQQLSAATFGPAAASSGNRPPMSRPDSQKRKWVSAISQAKAAVVDSTSVQDMSGDMSSWDPHGSVEVGIEEEIARQQRQMTRQIEANKKAKTDDDDDEEEINRSLPPPSIAASSSATSGSRDSYALPGLNGTPRESGSTSPGTTGAGRQGGHELNGSFTLPGLNGSTAERDSSGSTSSGRRGQGQDQGVRSMNNSSFVTSSSESQIPDLDEVTETLSVAAERIEGMPTATVSRATYTREDDPSSSAASGGYSKDPSSGGGGNYDSQSQVPSVGPSRGSYYTEGDQSQYTEDQSRYAEDRGYSQSDDEDMSRYHDSSGVSTYTDGQTTVTETLPPPSDRPEAYDDDGRAVPQTRHPDPQARGTGYATSDPSLMGRSMGHAPSESGASLRPSPHRAYQARGYATSDSSVVGRSMGYAPSSSRPGSSSAGPPSSRMSGYGGGSGIGLFHSSSEPPNLPPSLHGSGYDADSPSYDPSSGMSLQEWTASFCVNSRAEQSWVDPPSVDGPARFADGDAARGGRDQGLGCLKESSESDRSGQPSSSSSSGRRRRGRSASPVRSVCSGGGGNYGPTVVARSRSVDPMASTELVDNPGGRGGASTSSSELERRSRRMRGVYGSETESSSFTGHSQGHAPSSGESYEGGNGSRPTSLSLNLHSGLYSWGDPPSADGTGRFDEASPRRQQWQLAQANAQAQQQQQQGQYHHTQHLGSVAEPPTGSSESDRTGLEGPSSSRRYRGNVLPTSGSLSPRRSLEVIEPLRDPSSRGPFDSVVRRDQDDGCSANFNSSASGSHIDSSGGGTTLDSIRDSITHDSTTTASTFDRNGVLLQTHAKVSKVRSAVFGQISERGTMPLATVSVKFVDVGGATGAVEDGEVELPLNDADGNGKETDARAKLRAAVTGSQNRTEAGAGAAPENFMSDSFGSFEWATSAARGLDLAGLDEATTDTSRSGSGGTTSHGRDEDSSTLARSLSDGDLSTPASAAPRGSILSHHQNRHAGMRNMRYEPSRMSLSDHVEATRRLASEESSSPRPHLPPLLPRRELDGQQRSGSSGSYDAVRRLSQTMLEWKENSSRNNNNNAPSAAPPIRRSEPSSSDPSESTSPSDASPSGMTMPFAPSGGESASDRTGPVFSTTASSSSAGHGLTTAGAAAVHGRSGASASDPNCGSGSGNSRITEEEPEWVRRRRARVVKQQDSGGSFESVPSQRAPQQSQRSRTGQQPYSSVDEFGSMFPSGKQGQGQGQQSAKGGQGDANKTGHTLQTASTRTSAVTRGDGMRASTAQSLPTGMTNVSRGELRRNQNQSAPSRTPAQQQQQQGRLGRTSLPTGVGPPPPQPQQRAGGDSAPPPASSQRGGRAGEGRAAQWRGQRRGSSGAGGGGTNARERSRGGGGAVKAFAVPPPGSMSQDTLLVPFAEAEDMPGPFKLMLSSFRWRMCAMATLIALCVGGITGGIWYTIADGGGGGSGGGDDGGGGGAAGDDLSLSEQDGNFGGPLGGGGPSGGGDAQSPPRPPGVGSMSPPKPGGQQGPSPSPTVSPAPTVDLSPYVDNFSRWSSVDSLLTDGTPQREAMLWIANVDRTGVRFNDAHLPQRYSLVVLYYALGGNGWLLPDYWLDPSRHECDWGRHVGCMSDPAKGRCVSVLELSGNGVVGTLPPEIGLLEGLVSLYMNKNTISGVVPKRLCDLSALTVLELSENSIQGPMPDCIGSLSKLNALDLSLNTMTGSLPGSLYDLRKLRIVDISYNAFSGTISDELSRLQALTVTDIRNNAFTGTLSTTIDQLPDLAFIHMDNNMFTGTIPKFSQYFSRREETTLSNNQLTGNIPVDLLSESYSNSDNSLVSRKSSATTGARSHEVFKYRVIDLSGNQLSGTLSAIVGFVSTLRHIDVSRNSFKGTIPNTVGQYGLLNELEFLDMSDNFLTGTLPHVGVRDKTRHLAFGGNNLSGGNFPAYFADYAKLEYLDLTGIQFGDGAKIHPGLSRMTSLTHLGLRSCNLGGGIPTSLGSVRSLVELDLGKNSLQGSIPTELGQLSALSDLKLDQNQLVGQVPTQLSQLEDIRTLELQKNELTGVIPSELSNLKKAECLKLQTNLFAGGVPDSICDLQSNMESNGAELAILVDCDVSCGCCVKLPLCKNVFYP